MENNTGIVSSDNIPVAAAGPGAIPDQPKALKSLLHGATETEYFTILNPMSVDFVGIAASTIPANTPFKIYTDAHSSVVSEADVAGRYGFAARHPEHPDVRHVQNRVLIPAGKTINIMGNTAQVVVKQLVDYMMQKAGKHLLMADPNARRAEEERIVMDRGFTQDLLHGRHMGRSEVYQRAIDKSNEETDETEFPGVDRTAKSPEAVHRGRPRTIST